MASSETVSREERIEVCSKCNALQEGNDPKNCKIFNVFGVCKYLAAESKGYDHAGIVGRFHIDKLHAGHERLIEGALADHPKVSVFLGLSHCLSTYRNPLDFEARKQMFKERFPQVNIHYVNDVRDDVDWSDTLDRQVERILDKDETIRLYGGRDSFIDRYSGKFPVLEMEPETYISATARRKRIAAGGDKNADWRRGAIWATMNQYPTCYPTVDMAFFDSIKKRILLARKPGEKQFRFVGGFVQPGQTLEDTVVRETAEETHLKVEEMEYQKSFVIDDWRYASEVNKITTSLFVVTKWTGVPEPDDDIEELRWFPFNQYTLDSIVPEHQEMFNFLLNKE